MGGGHGGRKAVHLLRWETLTKAKEEGGAGLRRAREMNWRVMGLEVIRFLRCILVSSCIELFIGIFLE